ncbi:DNA-binding GntR family transcriptional regulator [Nocardioides albertanoniae]|uniref:DNA-binding GntR family transcriptional regulator n=1 Tax=Nocardioides albertanoniae TaxID=1175486 RepID=A0A543A5R0_9ACTN|nr:GntR family transcriptional regulator [Nocardioides albertanoniae]TQL67920.1 DNA-binding GntR family transcriptional regulator [Nocardioides albertanoniae]
MTTTARARANTDTVHAQLRAELLAGIYAPGERLKFTPLCERYDASVSVVREALTRLAEQGLVVSEPNIGFRVMPLTVADLRDLTRTRIDIETLALRYAIEQGGVEWESDLVAAHHRLERTAMTTDTGGPERLADEWERAHAAFHAALIAGCDSPRLVCMTVGLRDASELYRRWSQPREPGRDVAGEHRRLMEAALARDTDAAVEALTAHYQHTTDILEAGLRAQ